MIYNIKAVCRDGGAVERARFEIVLCRNVYKGSNPFLCATKKHPHCGCFFVDIKKNHAIVAWFGRGLPMSLEIKTPIVYNESMTCQSKIKNTIGGY